MIKGGIGTHGRIEYFFQVFGAVAVLFIEMKLKGESGNLKERLKAIARVITECDGKPCASHVYILLLIKCAGCDFTNLSKNYSLPLSIHSLKYSGCFPGDSYRLRSVPDLVSMETSLPFILCLVLCILGHL